jgi:hypothetical protein
MLRPPDSLNAQPVQLAGDVAWALAVAAVLGDVLDDTEVEAEVLRRVAG